MSKWFYVKENKLLVSPIIFETLNEYFSIDFYGVKVRVPYFINTKKRKDLRSLVGKGSKDEIYLETKVWAQVKHMNLKTMNEDEIRNLMLDVGIGIDCSGFVLHALKKFYKKNYKKNIFKLLNYKNKSLRARLARFFRPIENVGANCLTSELNCKIVSIHDLRPGDLLRGVGKQKNAYHVAIVSKVEFIDKVDLKNLSKNRIKSIEYIHSHRGYGKENGVRKGNVIITHPKKGFLNQKWTEVHTDGKNYLLDDLTFKPEDSGFRRLDVLDCS